MNTGSNTKTQRRRRLVTLIRGLFLAAAVVCLSAISARSSYTVSWAVEGMPPPARLPATARVHLSIQPAVRTVIPGETFTVEVVVQAGQQPVDAVDVALDFDPTALQVLKIDPGTALPTVLTSTFDNTAGTLTFSAGKPLAGADAGGTFTLVTLHLQAQDLKASTSLSFAFQPPLRNTDVFHRGRSVFGSAVGGTVTLPTPGAGHKRYIPLVSRDKAW